MKLLTCLHNCKMYAYWFFFLEDSLCEMNFCLTMKKIFSFFQQKMVYETRGLKGITVSDGGGNDW